MLKIIAPSRDASFLLMVVLYYNMRVTVTYDHRLKRIGHPVRSAIHKLVIYLLFTLNRANRHSVESEPLTALRGEARVSRVS
jgi:hypothetical protein